MKRRRLHPVLGLMMPVIMLAGFVVVVAARDDHRVPATFERDAAGGYQA